MRHGIKIVVITTDEEAKAFMEHLESEKTSARADNYARERAAPIKWLECCCCGQALQGRDWWNRDAGYGLCDDCVELCCGGPVTLGQEYSSYGVAGVHFLIPQEERDNPPLVENRGVPLYGMDERLRIEYDGYVFWKGREIEHYSGSLLEDSERSREQARELIRRCEALEAKGVEINSTSVIWKWQASGIDVGD